MTPMRSGFRPEICPIRLWPLLPGLLLAACQAPEERVEPPEPAAQAEPVQAEPDPLELARQALAAGDTSRALNRIEDALPDRDEDAATWQLYGDTLLRFTEEEIAAGAADPGVIEGCYADADHSFRRALELEPERWTARYGLARTLLAQGDADGAWAAAEQVLSAADEQLQPAQRLALGRAGLALTVARVQAGQSVPAAARRAEAQLQQAAEGGAAEAVVVLSDLLAWQNLREDARRVLVEQLGRTPRDPTLLARLKNLDSADPAALVNDLELVRREQPGDAYLLWYLGEARYLQHLALIAAGDFLLGYEAIDRAEECFLQSMALEEGFASSCGDWLFLVRNARGWALWSEGRVDDAAQAFLASLEAAPERLEAEPGQGSLRLGVEAVLGHYFARERDMVKARSFLRRVTGLHQEEAMWWNNLGLACRDIAEPQERLGAAVEGEILDLFEESWSAYSRAVALAPDDANIVNDRALIAVYYLDHDLELAEAELRRAVEVGTAALAGVDRDQEPDAWQRLDMAIGDAWENLAYLDLMRYQRTDRAPGFLEQSSQHFPWQNRGDVQMLRGVLEELQSAESGRAGETEADGSDN